MDDLGLIPGLGRSPGEGNDNPLKNSCLENSMNRGAWWVIQSMGSQSDMTEGLNFTFFLLKGAFVCTGKL